jgi:glycosyltransferase involved in cell wall biosynthesis
VSTIDTERPTQPRPDTSTAPTKVELLVPANDVSEPELSLVVPALNEEITIEQFVDWCHEGLRRAGIVGEILIVDSSSDSTPQRAVAHGARVLRVPKRGLGRAYLDAIPYIRGKYVVMGDADCTYDFRELDQFAERFHDGYEFIMGSRFKGYIEKGSMPALHRYVGTPITTWILNRVYSSNFSDIHCGMRGVTVDGLKRMELQSQSWEYASEMVLKSVHLELRTTEVPVRFLKDQEGRVSHHKRMGWFSPFQAAWINLRAMFVYGADFFVLKPGMVFLALGLLLLLPLSFGSITIGAVTFSLYWQLLGLMLAIVGLQGVMLGCLAQTFFDYTGRHRRHMLALFRYTRAALVSSTVFLLGALCELPLIWTWLSNDLRLPSTLETEHYLGVTGIFLMVAGFTLFIFTLLINAAVISLSPARINVAADQPDDA